jgi:hypothetical protein
MEQPSGAWARGIAFMLNQLWRERVTHKSARLNPSTQEKGGNFVFTRHQLLDELRPEPYVGDILEYEPQKSRRSLEKAIRLLLANGIISSCVPINSMPERRKGWQESWYEWEKFEIRPHEQGMESILRILENSAKKRAP